MSLTSAWLPLTDPNTFQIPENYRDNLNFIILENDCQFMSESEIFLLTTIPVSICGLSPNYDTILKIAREDELLVIEDNAQCFLESTTLSWLVILVILQVSVFKIQSI